MHWLVRKSSFSKAQGLRETGSRMKTSILCRSANVGRGNNYYDATSINRCLTIPSTWEWNITKCLTIPSTWEWNITRCLTILSKWEWNITRCLTIPSTWEWNITRCLTIPSTWEWNITRCLTIPSKWEWNITRCLTIPSKWEWNARNNVIWFPHQTDLPKWHCAVDPGRPLLLHADRLQHQGHRVDVAARGARPVRVAGLRRWRVLCGAGSSRRGPLAGRRPTGRRVTGRRVTGRRVTARQVTGRQVTGRRANRRQANSRVENLNNNIVIGKSKQLDSHENITRQRNNIVYKTE